MAFVTIKYLHPELMATFMFGRFEDNEYEEFVNNPNNYNTIATYASHITDAEDAAEEAFDITNNPSREKERFDLIGRSRSLSVGDIVEVVEQSNGPTRRFVCESVGWKELF